VVVTRIKGVAAMLEKFASFYGLVGFVGVERATVEFVGSQPEGECDEEREGYPASQGGGEQGVELRGACGAGTRKGGLVMSALSFYTAGGGRSLFHE
jgi:hypothetical protein